MLNPVGVYAFQNVASGGDLRVAARCSSGVPVTAASSAVLLGASFPLSGVSWCPRVPLGVRQDFAVQLSSLRSLLSLRLPPLW